MKLEIPIRIEKWWNYQDETIKGSNPYQIKGSRRELAWNQSAINKSDPFDGGRTLPTNRRLLEINRSLKRIELYPLSAEERIIGGRQQGQSLRQLLAHGAHRVRTLRHGRRLRDRRHCNHFNKQKSINQSIPSIPIAPSNRHDQHDPSYWFNPPPSHRLPAFRQGRMANPIETDTHCCCCGWGTAGCDGADWPAEEAEGFLMATNHESDTNTHTHTHTHRNKGTPAETESHTQPNMKNDK